VTISQPTLTLIQAAVDARDAAKAKDDTDTAAIAAREVATQAELKTARDSVDAHQNATATMGAALDALKAELLSLPVVSPAVPVVPATITPKA
jgi:hypothetical protein